MAREHAAGHFIFRAAGTDCSALHVNEFGSICFRQSSHNMPTVGVVAKGLCTAYPLGAALPTLAYYACLNYMNVTWMSRTLRASGMKKRIGRAD